MGAPRPFGAGLYSAGVYSINAVQVFTVGGACDVQTAAALSVAEVRIVSMATSITTAATVAATLVRQPAMGTSVTTSCVVEVWENWDETLVVPPEVGGWTPALPESGSWTTAAPIGGGVWQPSGIR